MIKQFFFTFVFCLTIAAFVAGCGIKPESLNPPDEEKGADFPQTYPDPDTLEP